MCNWLHLWNLDNEQQEQDNKASHSPTKRVGPKLNHVQDRLNADENHPSRQTSLWCEDTLTLAVGTSWQKYYRHAFPFLPWPLTFEPFVDSSFTKRCPNIWTLLKFSNKSVGIHPCTVKKCHVGEKKNYGGDGNWKHYSRFSLSWCSP